MLEQVYDTMGSFGDTRIKLIKSNFKSIIDNILTPDLKVFLAWVKWLSLEMFADSFSQDSSLSVKLHK